MSNESDLRAHLRALCAELGPDDGLTTHELRKQDRLPVRRQRHRRLAGQIVRILRLTLEAHVDIVDCVPDPDASRFCVRVRSLDAQVPPSDLIDHLNARRRALRAEIAQGIHRRRAPELRFEWAGPVEEAS